MLPNKTILTPGPWSVTGNTVKDGYGNTVCVVFARHATAHAHWIARIPEFAELGLDVDEIEALKEKAEEADDAQERLEVAQDSAEGRVYELEDALSAAQEHIRSLEEQLARATRVVA